MRKNAAGLGNAIVITWPSLTSIPHEGLGKGRRILVSEEDIYLVRAKAKGLGAISAEFNDTLKLRRNQRTLNVPVSGVEPVFAEMRNLIPTAKGRFISPIDHKKKRRVVFLGDRLAEQVFGEEDPVGKMVNLNGSPFLVVGTLKKKIQNSNYYGPDDRRAYIPSTTFRTVTGQKYVDNFLFTASDVSQTENVKQNVMEILAKKHRFHPEDREAMGMWDTTEMSQFLDTFMLAFQAFLAVVGSLTLVVGGIGVSNIMNVVVEERTPEIGIKMSLGARPRAILGQFLLETLVFTAVGGIIGLLIAAGICAAFPLLDLTDFVGRPEISLAVASITAALLGIIGFIAGFFPARTAARLDPVVAMKM
jgi:putative ABC transport system permease protein